MKVIASNATSPDSLICIHVNLYFMLSSALLDTWQLTPRRVLYGWPSLVTLTPSHVYDYLKTADRAPSHTEGELVSTYNDDWRVGIKYCAPFAPNRPPVLPQKRGRASQTGGAEWESSSIHPAVLSKWEEEEEISLPPSLFLPGQAAAAEVP